jgi:SP family sugar:H+ symporter-like MFS transporter
MKAMSEDLILKHQNLGSPQELPQMARDLGESQNANMGFIIFISVVATIGGFLFGFDSGVINGTVDGLQAAFNSNSVGTGFNVASMLLGCAVGAFFAGTLADRLGRKFILIISSVMFIISAWGSGIATTSGEFIVYRIIGGLAVGAASILTPAYISEVTPAQYRGRLSSIQQVAIISGLFFAFLSNYMIAGSAGGTVQEFAMGYQAWRWMFWVELVPAGVFFFALLFIPESPRFLVAQKKTDKALAVLKKLMKGGAVSRTLEDIQSSLGKSTEKPKLKDITHGKYLFRPIIWVGIALAAFQQLVGINVVFYYGSVLWQSAGFGESDALLINVISGGVSIGACVVATLLVDKIGRKPLLLVGSIGMSVALTVMSVTFLRALVGDDGALKLEGNSGMTALIGANLYVIFFNISWGPVMWVMLGEMFPNAIRGSALAVAGLVQWASNFLITMTFPMLLSSAGLGGAYGLYAFFAIISIPFILKCVKETAGLKLEEMEG